MKSVSFEDLEKRYDLISQPYGIYTHPNGKQFYFDKEYYEAIKRFNWTFIKKRNTTDIFLPSCPIISKNEPYVPKDFQNKKILYLPTFLLALKDKENLKKIETKRYVIGYHNQNFIDYRTENMYLKTISKRNFEANIKPSPISGVRGVRWVKRNKKWVARIWVNKQNIYLGIYDNLEDAVRARKRAEEQYYAKS